MRVPRYVYKLLQKTLNLQSTISIQLIWLANMRMVLYSVQDATRSIKNRTLFFIPQKTNRSNLFMLWIVFITHFVCCWKYFYTRLFAILSVVTVMCHRSTQTTCPGLNVNGVNT